MDTIWWTRVPNTRSLVESVAENLLREKTVLLQYEEPVPWKGTFTQIIREYVGERNSSKSFAMISNVDDPGRYLLEEYCKAEKRAQYRPTKGYAAFFAESDDIVLHEHYFWVNIETRQELNSWCAFASDYASSRSRGKSKAVFVLDCRGLVTKNRHKRIVTINIDELISEYDKRIFSTLVTGSIKANSLLKSYLTELLISVIGEDVELLAEAASDYSDFLKDPLTEINSIIGTRYRSDGESFVFAKEKADIEHAIWKAQIKAIYPMIEEYRQAFIGKHDKQINTKCLPVENNAGEIINDSQGLELGTLVYLVGINKLVLNTEEYERLVQYKDARNTLSHLGVLDLSQIEKLFMNY